MTSPDVFALALALPVEERASLAAELLASLAPPDAPSEDDPALVVEIAARAERVRQGRSLARPWADVRDELLARLGR